MIEGWYYLHENGDLIFKRGLDGTCADIRESNFAKALWPFDSTDRAGAWRIIIEALAAGAKRERVLGLAEKWGCNEKDAKIYAKHLGLNIDVDGSAFCSTIQDKFINIQESVCGFGDTVIDALVSLCTELGYKPSKMWGNDFAGLIKAH